MAWSQIIWDDSPGGNVEHVEEHDLTTDEVDYVLANYESKTVSRSSGRPCLFGYTPDGRYIQFASTRGSEDEYFHLWMGEVSAVAQ